MAETVCPNCGCARSQHAANGCVNHKKCPVTHMDPMWKKGQPKP